MALTWLCGLAIAVFNLLSMSPIKVPGPICSARGILKARSAGTKMTSSLEPVYFSRKVEGVNLWALEIAGLD